MCNPRNNKYLFLSQRQKEKQTSRDEDQRQLDCGEITRDELRKRNGLFAFPNVKINFKSAKSFI
jgi:hypothetical protein